MMDQGDFLPAQLSQPYPPVRAERRNLCYAQAILSNVGGAVSEMTAVGQYVYGQWIVAGVPEAATALHQISLVEMHHLKIFGTLALQLGADPRLWSLRQGRRAWWTPEYISYTRRLLPLLHNALREERAAIRKYRNQAAWIRDGNVAENLHRILLDEEHHVEILTRLIENYSSD